MKKSFLLILLLTSISLFASSYNADLGVIGFLKTNIIVKEEIRKEQLINNVSAVIIAASYSQTT